MSIASGATCWASGLIEPIDDIRAGNPPSNPELLKRLTDQFVASGFNTQDLLRLICKSRVYQQSIETNRWNEDDQINYSHALARRLPAEILYDTVNRATGSTSKLPGVPTGYRASQLPGLRASSCPAASWDSSADRRARVPANASDPSGVILGQALNLVNGPIIADAIANPQNRITQLVVHATGRCQAGRRSVRVDPLPPAERKRIGRRRRGHQAGREPPGWRTGSRLGVDQQPVVLV